MNDLQGAARWREILVVDDGSTDDTGAQATSAGARVIRHPYNKGNGASSAVVTLLYELRSAGHQQLGQTRDAPRAKRSTRSPSCSDWGIRVDRVDRLAQWQRRALSLPRPMAQRKTWSSASLGSRPRSRSSGCTRQAVVRAADGRLRVVSEERRRGAGEKVAAGLSRAGRAAARDHRWRGGQQGLRAHAQAAAAAVGVRVYVPPFASCTDNAAMIAYAGSRRLIRGEDDGLDLSVFSRSPILGATPGSPAMKRYKSSRLPRV